MFNLRKEAIALCATPAQSITRRKPSLRSKIKTSIFFGGPIDHALGTMIFRSLCSIISTSTPYAILMFSGVITFNDSPAATTLP